MGLSRISRKKIKLIGHWASGFKEGAVGDVEGSSLWNGPSRKRTSLADTLGKNNQ
jgi:hypothetical protein